MGGVNQMACNTEGYWIALRPFKVATPPVVIIVVFVYPFDKDQQLRVDGQNRVAAPGRGRRPVMRGV